jgi:hypothetical protein
MYRLFSSNKCLVYLTGVLLLLTLSCTPVMPQTTSVTDVEPELPPVELTNKQPVIQLISAPQKVAPSSNNRISCEASDADGDTLVYAWNADEGTIYGSGDTVTWIAPAAAGAYKISATVSDSRGGISEGSIYISVSVESYRPPNMSLNVTQKGKALMIGSADAPTTVRVWSVLEIECIADDPDGDDLNYAWSASGGMLSGEGAKVEYIARDRGDHVITVIVSDSTGRQISDKIYLHIQCCGG